MPRNLRTAAVFYRSIFRQPRLGQHCEAHNHIRTLQKGIEFFKGIRFHRIVIV